MSTKKKATPPKGTPAYVVVRPLPSESPTFTEPERVFMSKQAAQAFAEERNRDIRKLTNPFEEGDPEGVMSGGERALRALLKKHNLPLPIKKKDYAYREWSSWWNDNYFNMSDAQRELIWNALDKFDWYKVQETTVE